MIYYFAELDENNVVTRVLSVESETPELGKEKLISIFGDNTYVITDKNSDNYAGAGMTWNEGYQKFVPKSFNNGWVFNFEEFEWQPPTPQPSENAYWENSIPGWVEATPVD